METRNTRWTGILNSSENRKRGALKVKETKARKTTDVLRNVLIRFFLSGSVLSRKRWSRIIPKEWKLLVACSESMHRVTTVVSGCSVKCNAIFAAFEIFRLDLKRCCWSVLPCGYFTFPIGPNIWEHHAKVRTTNTHNSDLPFDKVMQRALGRNWQLKSAFPDSKRF